MNRFILLYVACFGLAVGLFQNCTRQQFASFASSGARQGVTSFTGGSLAPLTPTVGQVNPSADPPVVAPGQSTIVTVAMVNVDHVDYVCAVASDLSASGIFLRGSLTPSQTSFTLSPPETSGCRFTGTGAKLASPVVADLAVTVADPSLAGSLTVRANPPTITSGQSTVLSAVMTNITNVAYACSVGADGAGAALNQGTLTSENAAFTFQPTQTSTCQFVGTGPGLAAPVTQSVTVTVADTTGVVGQLIVSANPATIAPGGSTFVTAQMTNIDQVVFACAEGADGSGATFARGALSPGDPSFAFAPATTAQCRFVGTGPNLTSPVARTLVVVVDSSQKPTASFTLTATPPRLLKGQSTTITASAVQYLDMIAYSCALDADPRGTVFAQGALSASQPSFVLSPRATATCQFSGSGRNVNLPAPQTLTVLVTDPSTTLVDGSFDVDASPASIASGQSTTLRATAITNLSSIDFACSDDADGASNGRGTLTPAAPTASFAPVRSSTCVFTGRGPNLSASVARTLRVSVADPEQLWTWHGLLYQTTCSPRTAPYCDSVEWATCAGAACRAPRIQCYAATPRNVAVHPEGLLQTTEPTGPFCYLRQANEPWIYR